jgi:hypothetical protein
MRNFITSLYVYYWVINYRGRNGRNIAHMAEMRYAYTVLVYKQEERGHLEDLQDDGMTMLQCVVKIGCKTVGWI